MRKHKNEHPPFLVPFLKVANFLIALGTPPLFALKILFWTTIWIGNFTLDLAKSLAFIFLGITSTCFWFLEIITTSPQHLNIKLPKFPHLNINYRFALPLIISLFLFVIVPWQIYTLFNELPNPQLLASRAVPTTTKIYDRNGILLYQFYSQENRTLVDIDTLPDYVISSTVAVEDKNFYHHHGFDPQGIVRAAFANSSGEITQGGSTITQQLIKSTLLSPERTLTRKIKELILAYWSESLYSKKQILSLYLNQIAYGGQAYGIEAASQTYFGHHAKDLTLAEATLLAGLLSAPTTYSPYGSHPELAKSRQKQVLKDMVDQGYLTSAKADETWNQTLKFAPLETEIRAPHFVMFVRDYLAQKYGLRAVEEGGLQVTTTLDYPLYESVNQTLKQGVLAQKYLGVGNGAALVTNPKTGEILSMNGSLDFFDTAHDGNVNVTIASRSPGSSIKPLNYALAFERGLITPGTIIDDRPTTYVIPGQSPYSPQNYDNRFHGRVPVRIALGSSYNIPAIKVLERNGLLNFIQFARTLGITTFTTPSRYGLSITLGGGEVRMVDMATAYSSFANQGTKVNLTPILEVKDSQGNVLENSSSPQSSRVLSPRTAFLISNILSDDSARAPTFGAGSALNIPGHTVAVKTGTAETKRDNWTIGYSFGPNPRLVAVWVGNNDNSPMSPYLESGNTGATAVWHPLMVSVLKDQPNAELPRPDDLVPVQICAGTNLLTCPNCPLTITEYYSRGQEPKTACKIDPPKSEENKDPNN